MKNFVIACVAAIVIALVAAWALNFVQMPVSEAFMSPVSTRI